MSWGRPWVFRDPTEERFVLGTALSCQDAPHEGMGRLVRVFEVLTKNCPQRHKQSASLAQDWHAGSTFQQKCVCLHVGQLYGSL